MVAVFLVFVVHVFQVFSPMGPWYVQDRTTSLVLGQFTVFLAPWIMPLFMLLAGTGAWYSLRKRAPGPYLLHRLRRIGIPLVAGTLVVVPPQMYVRRLQEGRFAGSFLEFYPRFFDGLYPVGNFTYGHLWFLAYVLLYSLVTLPLIRWVESPGGRHRIRSVVRWIDRSGAPLLLSLPLAIPLVALQATFPLSGNLVGDWAAHAWLISSFMAGYILMAEPRMQVVLRRRWPEAILPGALASVGLALWAGTGDALTRLPSSPGAGYLLFWTAWGVASGCWMMVAMGAGRRWLRRPSATRTRWGDAAYPFYILHHPAVALTAFAVVGWRIPFAARVGLVFALSLAATLLAMEFLRRAGPLGRLLGMDTRMDHPGGAPPLDPERT